MKIQEKLRVGRKNEDLGAVGCQQRELIVEKVEMRTKKDEPVAKRHHMVSGSLALLLCC